jgi:transketolase
MRNVFASEITKLAGEDPRVVLLSGDIGNKLFDAYKERHAARFFNCGVAEANMVGVAAGMALTGLRPVTYTIASFMTYRCFEQIRVDVCYHHLPVVIVGVGAGLSYAANAGTHHCCEDVAVLRALPGMTVLCPGDPAEVAPLLRSALAHDGPVYLRLGKKGEPQVHAAPPPLTIGRSVVVRDGHDVCLLSTGTMLPTVVEAARRLEEAAVSARVVSLPTIKPLDEALVAESAGTFPLVVTIEEHSVVGGLGSAVAEYMAEQPVRRARLLRIGTADAFMHEAGEQEHAREYFGLTPGVIAGRILETLSSRP